MAHFQREFENVSPPFKSFKKGLLNNSESLKTKINSTYKRTSLLVP